MDVPQLIEPNMKYYLYETLKKCHMNRTTTYYYILNIGIFAIFCFFTAMILYFCYKNKLSDHDKKNKLIRDQQYVLSKIRYYQDESQKSNVSNFNFRNG